MNSYEIYMQARDLVARLIDAGGEVDENTERELSDLLDKSKEKLDSHRFVINRAKAESAVLQDEIKRLQNIKKIHDKTVERVKQHALLVMEARVTSHGWDEGRTVDDGAVYIKKRQKLVIGDVDGFCHANRRRAFISYEPKIDRVLLNKQLKAGKTIDGAELVEDYSIVFKS
jgi:hypothetical protein|tara:strand:+ start:3741 stop:4256 length:516 start_codon:yes stop_codon:yes gene_type:complete